jgi:hypothetical protein
MYWRLCNEFSVDVGVQTGGVFTLGHRDAHRGAEAKGSRVAAPRRRLPLMRLAALPDAHAERRANGGVENGLYVFGLRPVARLEAGKNTRRPGEGSSTLPTFRRPLPPARERAELTESEDVDVHRTQVLFSSSPDTQNGLKRRRVRIPTKAPPGPTRKGNIRWKAQ